jgi:BlaI family transcriptional regulator, penicillinase repressor
MLQTPNLRLGRRELEILNIVWDLGEATVQDVCHRLERRAAYSTVLTMMRTLENKGVLDHRTTGRTFVYRAQISREHVQSSMLRSVRDVLFNGSSASLMNTMLNQTPMSAQELDELRRLLDQAAESRDSHA